MKATEVSLNSFLSQTKTQFIIPVYQRNYDWTEYQCAQLFNDIIKVGEKINDTHFIGSIVFIHEGVYTSSDVKQLVIIDGQQRLTTFSLLYLALYKFALKNNLEERASEIKETYLVNKYVKDDLSKLKLKQSDVNAKAFKFLLTNSDTALYSDFSRLIENYNFFSQNVNTDNFEKILKGINNLLFVEISLERGKDDPQRIFESLNSTGLELSQADLIRNYILMGLDPNEQTRVFNNFWEIIEANAKDVEREESVVSDFIRDYLTFKTKKIPNKSKVYEEFKNRYPVLGATFYNETLQELKNFSFHYHKLVNPQKEPDADLRREIDFIRRLEANTTFPFLMPVYNDYQEGHIEKADFKEILILLQSFIWRRFVLNLGTNSLNRIFMTLYNEVDESDYVPSIKRAILRKKGRHKFPTNVEIEIALFEKDVYNIQSKNRTYFLEKLENHNNREYVSVNNPDITIEHIFPQSPDEQWYNDLDTESIKAFEEKFLNTIANLTLSGNNGSLSNKTFLEKKNMNRDGKQQGYNFSRLWLNQYLREINDWNIDRLNERFKLLLDRFFEIWQYPEVEMEDEFDTDEDYSIYDAPDPKFKKLDYFIFKDEKVVTTDVSKMYHHVIKVLFNENPSAFQHQEVRDLLALTANPRDLRAPYSISPTYYVESNIDSNTRFRRLKSLLTRFGYEDELLINFSSYEPEESAADSIDRQYWEKKSDAVGMAIVDECQKILNRIDTELSITYTVSYIGLSKGKKAKNFILFFPRRGFSRVGVMIKNPETWIEELKNHGIEYLSISKKNGRLKFRLTREDIAEKKEFLHTIFTAAYESRMN